MRTLTLALLLFSGCAARVSPPPIVWNHDLAWCAPLWQREAESRFGPDVQLVLCHGTESDDGTWECIPQDQRRQSVESVARAVSAAHPTSTVVLIVCNPNSRTIHVPGGRVYYSRRVVSCLPHDGAKDRDDSIWWFSK